MFKMSLMRILSVTLLVLSTCLFFQSGSAGNSFSYTRKRPPPCCVEVSTANISIVVTGDTYREQSAESPCVDAIIFTTQFGQVCVDPKAKWVQKLTANMTKL